MPFEGFERLCDGLQDGFAGDAVTGMADEGGDAPAGGLQLSALRIQRSFSLSRQAVAVK